MKLNPLIFFEKINTELEKIIERIEILTQTKKDLQEKMDKIKGFGKVEDRLKTSNRLSSQEYFIKSYIAEEKQKRE